MNRKLLIISALSLLAAFSAGCGGDTATTTSNAKPGETKAKAEDILAKMTEKIKAAPAISFTTAESADRRKRGGEMKKMNVTRNVTLKSPDRLYFKVSGDNDMEAYYDGKDMTLVSHKDKVWGKFPAAANLSETVDRVKEQYGMPLPVADLLGLDAKGKLRNAANTSSMDKKETVGGVECNVLTFKNADVDWEVWIPVTGDPLPKKFHAKYKTEKGQPESTFEFSDWNVAAQVTDATFTAKVPEDYEGIPVIQRAAAVIPKIQEEEKKAAANANTGANTAVPPPPPTAGNKK